MVAKVSVPTAVAPAATTDGGAGSSRPWHQSPFHVKIACDAVAVAILLSIVAVYLAIAFAV